MQNLFHDKTGIIRASPGNTITIKARAVQGTLHLVFGTAPSKKERMENRMDQQMQEQKNKEYNDYVKRVTPTHNLFLSMVKAFLIGGLICVLGQFILNTGLEMGLDRDMASSWCSLILVALSVLFTGLNLYPKLAKFGGAGTLVPITGFANSVAASAIEYKKEGQVFGIGCKIFTIAGPVILYGIFSSSLLGLIYWALGLWGFTW